MQTVSDTQPEFPMFIVDEDETVIMLECDKDIYYNFEQNDIDDADYLGWDVRGYPLRLVNAEGGTIRADVTGGQSRLDELREAILTYGRVEQHEFKPDVGIGVVELYRSVKDHVGARRVPPHGLLWRLKDSLWGRLIQRRQK